MAHHRSTQKRVRQSAKQRQRNRAYRSSLRTALKKLEAGIVARHAGNLKPEDLMTMMRHCQSLLMKSVTKNRLKKNNAARKIKRLAHRVKAACLA